MADDGLEPAVIGDQLLRERLEAGGDGAAFTHWLGGSEPVTVAGTSKPGNVHLSVDWGAWTYFDMPELDLSWTPPDVHAILGELFTAHDMHPQPSVALMPDLSLATNHAQWVDALVEAMIPPSAVQVLDDTARIVHVTVSHLDPDTGQMADGWAPGTQENWPTEELKAITEEDE